MFTNHLPLSKVSPEAAHRQHAVIVGHIIPGFHHHGVPLVVKHGCEFSPSFPVPPVIVCVLPYVPDILERRCDGQELMHLEVVSLVRA